MKELTIEQKAKAYDEAIKRGLDYIKHTPTTEMVTRQDIFEAIFPEFKESEDEKIRKALLNEFIHLQSKGYKFAGLEGEEIITWLEKQKDHEDELERAYKCADEVQYRKGYEAAKREFEKQGVQKPKNKPKFKVGDWITNSACTIQITSVDDTYYWYDNDCVGGDIESMDKEYHLLF